MIKETKKQKEENKQIAIDKLQSMLKHGQTVYTSLKGVSSSGMSRKISVYIVEEVKDYNGNVTQEISDITWLVAKALECSRDQKSGALKVQGAGMDMGFDVVYRLSSKVFKDVTGIDFKDAGYVLKQRWL